MRMKPECFTPAPGILSPRPPRLIVTLHYDDFARFFRQVELHLKTLAGAEVLFLASHRSGWLYLRRHGSRRVLMPLSGLRTPVPGGAWSARERFVAAYHLALAGDAGPCHAAALQAQTRALIGRIDALVASFQPDALVLSGDSRNIERALATATDAPRVFFEQGPARTTILDPAGVNANCSFRLALAGIRPGAGSVLPTASVPRARRNPVYRGVDHAGDALLRALHATPPHKRMIRRGKVPARLRARATAPLSGPVVLVALQVAEDANHVFHNPLHLDAEALADWAAPVAAAGMPVRFREHPLARGRYGRAFYEAVAACAGLSVSDSPLESDLDAARCVVTVNSTTGMDAYRRGLPVVVLGEAYWDHLPGIRRAASPGDLVGEIAAVWGTGDPRRAESQPRAFAEFYREYLIAGHFRDATSDAPRHAAEKIIAVLENGNPAAE